MNGTISWTAPLYDRQEHSADWFWAAGIFAASFVIASFIMGNALLSIIILVGTATLLFHAKNPPEVLEYSLSSEGVRAGKTLHPWDTLESFWIVDEINTSKEHASAKILITSKKAYIPHIVIPLGDTNIENVYHVLSRMLAEVHQEEPLVDRVMRKLGI